MNEGYPVSVVQVPSGQPDCKKTEGFCNMSGICHLSSMLSQQAQAGGDIQGGSKNETGPYFKTNNWESFAASMKRDAALCLYATTVIQHINTVTQWKEDLGHLSR